LRTPDRSLEYGRQILEHPAYLRLRARPLDTERKCGEVVDIS
jgi:hypothetical protein